MRCATSAEGQPVPRDPGELQRDAGTDMKRRQEATDVTFRRADFLRRLMPLLVRHGMLSLSSPDVMRYFGRKVNPSVEIPANFSGTLETDMKRRQEGVRVKYQIEWQLRQILRQGVQLLGQCAARRGDHHQHRAGPAFLTGPKREVRPRVYSGKGHPRGRSDHGPHHLSSS